MPSIILEYFAFFVEGEILIIGEHEVTGGVALKFNNITIVQLFSRVDKIHLSPEKSMVHIKIAYRMPPEPTSQGSKRIGS